MGTNTFKLQVAGITKTASIEVVEDITFTVHFERKKDYDGEFGFDWMRDNYKTISQNYEELKKEYKDAQINGSEYFVPYLSMLPNQENVIFNLNLDIIDGKARKDDIIKFPAKDGIKFEPNEISVKDLQKEQEAIEKEKAKEFDGDVSSVKRTEIKVICENALAQDTSIELLDKNDNIVGQIIVVKNNEILDLNIRIVKVVRKTSKERDLKGINDALKTIDLEKYLNNNSLQQALVKTTIDSNQFVLELDKEKLDRDQVENQVSFNGAEFIGMDNKVSSMLRNYYIEEYEKENKHKGIILFLTPIRKKGSAGDGQLWFADRRNCSIFYDGLFSATTYAHEIAHVLGCEHPFDNDGEMIIKVREDHINKLTTENITFRNEIEQYEKDIVAAEKRIEEMKKYPNNPTAINNIKVNTSNIKVLQSNIKNREEAIEKREKLIEQDKNRLNQAKKIQNHNTHVFTKQGSTEDNFMDYISPKSNRKSFWKWQWEAIKDDIKTYYS